MNKVNSFILSLVSFVWAVQCSAPLQAQSILSHQEVLTAVAENNYDIAAARQSIASAEVLTSKYNRGYLPSLGIDAGLGFNLSGIKQAFNFNFPDIDIQNIQSYNGNIGVGSTYLIYDGGTRSLRNEQNLSNLDFAHSQVDNISKTISYNASQIYYRIAQAMFNLDLLKETLEISKTRNDRTKTFYEYGKLNRVDLSNAKVDVVRDSLNLISVENDIVNLKWQLNQLILRKETNYEVDTAFQLIYQLADIEDLENQMLAANTELIVARKNREIVDYNLAIANKINAPQIAANGAYNINYQDFSSNSQQDFVRSNGLNLGLTANWNILDGGQRKVQEQLAIVEQANADLALSSKENELITRLNVLWNTYQNNLLRLSLEKQNIATNKENFELVRTLYENGQQSSVEFRQAQLNLLNAQSQYYNVRTEAKILELEIDLLLAK